ncbi:hypothetical protein GCM10009621_22360 [Corynebacterium felinum]
MKNGIVIFTCCLAWEMQAKISHLSLKRERTMPKEGCTHECTISKQPSLIPAYGYFVWARGRRFGSARTRRAGGIFKDWARRKCGGYPRK